MSSSAAHADSVSLPRVTITYCTQCRWMLRAAYFGQELLSTFGTQIGEVALVPTSGGVFRVELTYIPPSSSLSSSSEEDGATHTESETAAQQHNQTAWTAPAVQKALLWDRKAEGGFPETKVLKQRVRDYIDPSRDLGHSDRGGKKKDATATMAKEGDGEGKKDGGGNVEGERKEGEKEGVKRNPDGSICEDCR